VKNNEILLQNIIRKGKKNLKLKSIVWYNKEWILSF